MGHVTPTRGPHGPVTVPEPDEPEPDVAPLLPPLPLLLLLPDDAVGPVGELELHAAATAMPKGNAKT